MQVGRASLRGIDDVPWLGARIITQIPMLPPALLGAMHIGDILRSPSVEFYHLQASQMVRQALRGSCCYLYYFPILLTPKQTTYLEVASPSPGEP